MKDYKNLPTIKQRNRQLIADIVINTISVAAFAIMVWLWMWWF